MFRVESAGFTTLTRMDVSMALQKEAHDIDDMAETVSSLYAKRRLWKKANMIMEEAVRVAEEGARCFTK